MKSRASFGLALSLFMLTGWWFALGPQFLGGPAGYVIVSGHSMEPTLFTGDLAVVRRQSEYEVGDVIAFRVQGGSVIHRIIGGDAVSGFVMQGDNNPNADRWRPTPAEISGTMWFHVPDAGGWLARLRSPRNLNLLGAVAVALMVPLGSSQALEKRRSRRKRMNGHAGAHAPSATSGGLGSMPPLPGALILPLAIGAGMVLLFAAIGFGAFRATSSDPEFVERFAYEQQGDFNYYLSMEPSRLYPGGLIAPSEPDDGSSPALRQPVYTNLAREMVVRFAYTLTSSQAVQTEGELGLQLIVQAGDGWTQTAVTGAPVPFEGNTASGELRIDFAEIAALIATLEEETGFKPPVYDLVVTPTVSVHGTVGDQPIDEVFGPTLVIAYSDTEIIPAPGVSQIEPTSIGESIQVANHYAPLGIELSVSRWRTVAIVGLAGGFTVVAAVLAIWFLGIGRDEDGKIEARYHSMLLRVRPGQVGPSGHGTQLASMHDLVRLARRDGGIIFVEARANGRRYFVRDGEDTYEYLTGGAAPDADRPFASLSELVQDH